MSATPRVHQVRLLALTVFGDIDAATAWLDKPNPVLDGLRPEVCAQTPTGLQRVLQVLSAIETGGVA